MLKLHHSPLACSLASRFALAESGLDHELSIVNTGAGENKLPAYIDINPRGKVPALETPDGVLTESIAILTYIADLVPEKSLFPAPQSFERATGLSWLSFLSSSVHASLSQIIRPRAGCEGEAAKQSGLDRITEVFQDLDTHLEGRDHVLEGFSVCDLYLTVFSLWRGAPEIGGALKAFSNVDRLQNSTLARPALSGILESELKLRAGA
jgi:glutathione S-transferase